LLTPIERTSPRSRSATRARQASTVEVVQAEALQGLLDRLHREVVLVVPARDLGGDLHLLARQPGLAQRLADLGLVAIVDR
jgi:hypothetical protein